MSDAQADTAETVEVSFHMLFDLHEDIDLMLRRAIGIVDLISTYPDGDDCIRASAEGAAWWLRQAKEGADRIHDWWCVHRR